MKNDPYSVLSKCTVLLKAGGSRGTGFLIWDPSEVPNQGGMFLVTNKHVVEKSKSIRESLKAINLCLNLKNGSS